MKTLVRFVSALALMACCVTVTPATAQHQSAISEETTTRLVDWLTSMCDRPGLLTLDLDKASADLVQEVERALPRMPTSHRCNNGIDVPVRAVVAVKLASIHQSHSETPAAMELYEYSLPAVSAFADALLAKAKPTDDRNLFLMFVTNTWLNLSDQTSSTDAARLFLTAFNPVTCSRSIALFTQEHPVPNNWMICANAYARLTDHLSALGERDLTLYTQVLEKFTVFTHRAVQQPSVKAAGLEQWSYLFGRLINAWASVRTDTQLESSIHRDSDYWCMRFLQPLTSNANANDPRMSSLVVEALNQCMPHIRAATRNLLLRKAEFHVFSPSLSPIQRATIVTVVNKYLSAVDWPFARTKTDAQAWMRQSPNSLGSDVNGLTATEQEMMNLYAEMQSVLTRYGADSQQLERFIDNKILSRYPYQNTVPKTADDPIEVMFIYTIESLRAAQIARKFRDGEVKLALSQFNQHLPHLRQLFEFFHTHTKDFPRPLYDGVYGTLLSSATNYIEMMLRMRDVGQASALSADFIDPLEPLANSAENHRQLKEAHNRIAEANRVAGYSDEAARSKGPNTSTRETDVQESDYTQVVIRQMACIGKGDLDCVTRTLKQLERTSYADRAERDCAQDYLKIIRGYLTEARRLPTEDTPADELALQRASLFFSGGYAQADVILMESQFFGSGLQMRPIEELDLLGNVLFMCSILPDDQSGVCLPAAHRYLQTLASLYAHIDAGSTNEGRTFASSNNPILRVLIPLLLAHEEFENAEFATDLIHVGEFADFVGLRGGPLMKGHSVSVSAEEATATKKLRRIGQEVQKLLTDSSPTRTDALSPGTSEQDTPALKAKKREREATLLGLARQRPPAIVPAPSAPEPQLAADDTSWRMVVTPSEVIHLLRNGQDTQVFRTAVDAGAVRLAALSVRSAIKNHTTLVAKDLDALRQVIGDAPRHWLESVQAKAIRFVPDDVFKLLPLELVLGSVEDLPYTITLAGAGTPKVSDSPTPPLSGLFAFGMADAAEGLPALRSVPAELNSIAAIVSGVDRKAPVNVYLNRDFTKKTFTLALASPRQYVHIASHYLLTGDGIGGGQLLVGDGTRMSTREIWEALPSLKHVSLVALSACDTGASLRNGGAEHIDGLSNVFLSRGADRVVGTLWAVPDDATADFMRVFYDFYLTEKRPAAEAVRAAKKAFINGGRMEDLPTDLRVDAGLRKRLSSYHDPAYWAAFQVYSPRQDPQPSRSLH